MRVSYNIFFFEHFQMKNFVMVKTIKKCSYIHVYMTTTESYSTIQDGISKICLLQYCIKKTFHSF